MSDNKSSDYLEGNYDGKNMVSLVGQIEADIKEAIVISQKAEKKKEEAEENEAKRILGKESVTEEDIDKILEDYATNEEYKQYLMDGAVLQCNQATLEPFKLPDRTQIDLVLNADENGEERKQTNLRILDESMSANDTLYATVLDTEKEENIFPFRCHCKKGVDREEEYTKIKNDPSCKTDGVCKHLMMLSNEWDNLPLEGQLYKKRDVTIKITDDLNLIMKDTQCINMMSMLFCKHGGLITPVTSGQINMETQVQPTGISPKALRAIMALEILNDYSKDYLVIENGKLIGVKPHLAGDGLVTVAFGDCLIGNDLDFYLDESRRSRIIGELSDQVSDFDKIKDTVIPVEICFEKLVLDIEPLCQSVVSQFQKEGITLSQNQLDAIVIAKYQCYTLGEDAFNAIKDGKDRETLYNLFFKAHGGNGDYHSRTTVEMNIYFDSEYEVKEDLTDVIVEPLENLGEE